MGDAKQVKAVIESIKKHANFRQMSEYNISCLLTYITPPTVGWRENVAAAVEDEGIESIIAVLERHGGALDMVKQATTALYRLAISRENAGRVAENGGIETAVRSMLQISKNEEEVIDAGAKLMEQVARVNPESILQRPDAVQSMLQGVNYEQVPRVQIASAKVLDRIANYDQGIDMIVQQNGIAALIDAMAPGKPTKVEMLRPIFKLLERMARNPDYVRQIRACKGVEALVAQLDAHSDNEYILRAGGRLLAKIADSDIEETIRRMAGNLPDAVRQHLVGLLANLALQPENVEKIVANGGIEALLRGFDKYNNATKAAALRALQRIADTGATNVNKIIEAGGLPIIIDSIKNSGGDEDILKAATMALTSIVAAGLDQANLVHSEGGIKAVLDAMLKYPDLNGFTAAGLDLIAKLCSVGFETGELIKMGAADAIFAAMKNGLEDAEVQEKGFQALTSLMSAQDDKANKYASETIAGNADLGVLPDSLLHHAQNKNVVKEGIQTLAKLVTGSNKAIEALTNLLAIDSIIAAIYAQIKLEMLGQSRLSSDTTYVRNVKALLTSLVNPSQVRGLARSLAAAKEVQKLEFLMKAAVFSFNSDFTSSMLSDKIAQGVSLSLKQVIEQEMEGQQDLIVDHAVAIWSIAKTGLIAMSDLFDNSAVKNLLVATKVHVSAGEAVIGVYRCLHVFAANHDYKKKLVDLMLIENCVKAMRSNAGTPEVNVAAIDLLLVLGSTDDIASDMCVKGATRQILKMIKDNSTSLEFEKAIEKSLVLLYRVASVDKVEIKDQLRNQGTVDNVTIAMSSFPTNEEILEYGARILSLLMTAEDVSNAIDDVVKLTSKLGKSRSPDDVFVQLGQKSATVGFLSLNPKNLEIMEEKDAVNVISKAIKVSKTKPQTTKRENAVMNEYRAVGQVSSVIGNSSNVIDELLAALKDSEDNTSLLEKVGVLQAIDYLCHDPQSLNELLRKNAGGLILDLMKVNRSDERVLLASLNALSGLMADESGIADITSKGGADLIFNVLRDDGENLGHQSAEAALRALQKLGQLEMNARKLVEEGVVDTVTSTVAQQCEENEEVRPKVVGSAASLLKTLALNTENASELIVQKGALKKLLEVVETSPDYLTNDDCMQKIADLLEVLSRNEELRPKLRDLGAVDFMMKAMNMNPGNEELETTGQRVLQKLVGGDASALEQTLADYDRLLNQVKKKPDNRTALERLNRAGINLGNLMMVEGVVDAAGAAMIVERALETYDVVEKSPHSVGPIREQVLDTALQNIGKSTLIDGAMESVDLDRALALLTQAMADDTSEQLQIEALLALGKFVAEDERVLVSALKMGVVQQLEDVLKNTASPQVREAAEQALANIRGQVLKKPELVLSRGPENDKALAALLQSVKDPKDLEDLLKKITNSPFGTDALLRLALTDSGAGLSPDLRKAIFRALGNSPPGTLNIPPSMLDGIIKALRDPNVDFEEKAALLRLLGETKMSPEAIDALLKGRAIENILELLNDSAGKDENLLLAALGALAQMSMNPTLATQIAQLEGADTIAQVMKAHVGNKGIQERGFEALINLTENAGGPKDLNLSNDSLAYLESALGGLDPAARRRANQLVEDLKKLYNGEMGPMVVSRFDNMLDVLRAAKDWRELHDPKTGRPYYYNVVTGEKTWKKPAEMIAAENAIRNLEQLAAKNPAEIDPEKLREVIGLFNDQTAEPLRLKALTKALAALANNDSNRDAMVRHGVLNALVDAINSEHVDREFILAAIALLNQFALHPVFKEQICNLGGIEALIAIMMKYKEDEEIVWRCEQCLANLAVNSQLCIARIMKHKGQNAVAHALKNHKTSVDVNQHAMSLLSNLMFKNEANKKEIGDLLRDRIIGVLRRFYKNVNVLKQTGRCIGNIAFIDDHIRYVVSCHAVRSLIQAMEHHRGDNSVLKLGVDVIGNFATVDEEEYEQEIRAGRMVSVISTIWHEGGAKKILDTFGSTSDPKIVASCVKSLMHLLDDVDVRRKLIGMNVVSMLFSAMQKYDWDEDISDFCIDSIELLSLSYEGIESIYENDGLTLLLQQMEMNIEREEYVRTVMKTLVNMSNLRDHNKSLSDRVLNDLSQQRGVDTFVSVLEKHFHDHEYVRFTMRLLTHLSTLGDNVSHEIAQKSMRVTLRCVEHHKDNVEVLMAAYQLIGILAFVPENLKIIVQYGGINVIVNTILRYPNKEKLVNRSIKTLDNIAMGSSEHSNIVKQARGKEVIEELIRTYETLPGNEARDVVKACRAALLSLTKIETRKKNNELFFTNKEEADPNADPLKNHRVLLKTGETISFWKSGKKVSVHLFVREDNLQVVWKVPSKKRVVGSIDLRNLTTVHKGKMAGHGKKEDRDECFALKSTEKKNPLCFQCNDRAQRDSWYDALEALRLCKRNNNKKFLKL